MMFFEARLAQVRNTFPCEKGNMSRIDLYIVVERCTCMHAMQRPVVQVSQWATIFFTQESGCCQIHIRDNMITESDPTREESGSCDQ